MRDAADLDVHLKGGDALGRAGHLEVHVAVVVFRARDVAEHGVLARLLVHHEAHRDAGDRVLERHAGVHHRERTAADRGHRRRSVRLEDVRHDADGVRELLLGRKERRQRAFCQRAVSDLAPAGPAQERHFADRERREVVVEHEALPLLALEALDLLRIVGRAERAGDERLRLAAREHGRAVSARQHARLDPDRADLVELAAIEPYAALQDFVSQDLFLEVLEDLLRFGLALGLAFGQAGDEIGEDLVDAPVVVELVPDAHGVGERTRAPCPRLRRRTPWSISFLVTWSFGLPASLASASMPPTIALIAAWAAFSASTTWVSVTCLAPASTMTRPSMVPATTRSIRLCLRSAKLGLMTYLPSTRPTRTPAIVFWKGISDSARAAEAPVMASTSVSFSESADSTSAMICVS